MRFACVSVALLFACGPALGADKGDKAQTLADVLVQDDDGQPDGVTAGTAKTDQKDAPLLLRKLPQAQTFAFRPLEREGELTGSVSVFAYPNSTTRNSVFKSLSADFGDRATKLEGIGEKGVTVTTVVNAAGQNYSTTDIAYFRGNRVVFVRLIGQDPAASAKEIGRAHV